MKLRKSIDFISDDFDREACFAEFIRLCKIPNMIIFCSGKQVGKTLTWFEDRGLTTTLLVWQKTNPIPTGNMNYISECEFVVYVRAKGSCFNNDMPLSMKKKVYTSKICPDGTLHPTQKPLDLIRRYILLHSRENDVILDPFMGSGTTAIGCIKENRHFIGYELNNEFYNVARKRIEAEKQQLTLF